MREEFASLIAAGRQVIALLRAGVPLSQQDHAVLTSLTWHLIAALHAQKGTDTPGDKSMPLNPTEPSNPK